MKLKGKENRQSDKLINIVLGVSVTSLIFTLIPIFLISRYSRPAIDDFGTSGITKPYLIKGDIFGAIEAAWKLTVSQWHVWAGIWSSTFIQTFQPGVIDFRLYWINTLIIVGLLLLSVYFLTKVIVVDILKVDRRYGWILTCFVSAVYLNFMPGKVEGLFWFNGDINYSFFFFLDIFICGLCLSLVFINQKRFQIIYKTGLLVGLTVLAGGGEYVPALLSGWLCFCFVILLFVLKRKNSLKFSGIVVLICCWISLSFNVFAPGNKSRAKIDGFKISLVDGLEQSFFYSNKYLSSFTDFTMILLFILITPILVKIVKNIKYKKSVVLSLIGFSILTFYLSWLPWSSTIVSSEDRGTVGRYADVTFLLYILLVLLIISCLVVLLNKQTSKTRKLIPTVSIALVFAIGLNLLPLTKTTFKATNSATIIGATVELTNGTAKSFAKEFDACAKGKAGKKDKFATVNSMLLWNFGNNHKCSKSELSTFYKAKN
jgi:hypothetical protein